MASAGAGDIDPTVVSAEIVARTARETWRRTGRDSSIAFDLYPTQETVARGKHDGSIIGTVRDRSDHGATETMGWIDRWRRQPWLTLLPWSWELRNGWGLSGMFTEFIRPSDPTSKLITEAAFVIEKNVTERAGLFGEYVGDYPENGSSCPTVELGRTVSPQSNSAGGFPRRPGAQPQRPQLHCGHQIFGTVR
jgi:hypothetical protein